MKEEWLMPGAVVPVDIETTKALVDEIKRLIGVIGGMALKQIEKKEWVGLGTDEEIIELSKDAWGRDKLNEGRSSHKGFYVDFARLIEQKLKEKNTFL